jgi:glycosyltransferase involved in cell wall biosynthesis
MSRIGYNPAKKKSTSYRPAEITAATVTFIPSLAGYFSQRLETLKLTLASIRAHTEAPFNLMVFDNGSCPEVKEYLDQELSQGRIDFLIHSRRNLGVIGAFKVLFKAAPSELIAYCDDDVFYYPGWLAAHRKVMQHFPRVGMVSGAPVGTYTTEANAAVKRIQDQLQDQLTVAEAPRVLDWEKDWAVSTGRDLSEHIQWAESNPNLKLEYEGAQAIGAAKHFQFLTTKTVMEEALPSEWSGQLMHGLLELDRAVDELGYLRLCTPDRYTRHLGNTISSDMAQEAQKFGIQVSASRGERHKRHWLVKVPGAGRLLRKAYDWLFDVLNDT